MCVSECFVHVISGLSLSVCVVLCACATVRVCVCVVVYRDAAPAGEYMEV